MSTLNIVKQLLKSRSPVMNKLESLADRWSEEKQYEDINEYAAAIKAVLPKNIKFISISSSLFGFTFAVEGDVWRVKFNASSVSVKCLKQATSAQRRTSASTATKPVRSSHKQFTQKQLHEAFEMVQNKKNWKGVVRCTLPNPGELNIECARQAIVHFTGSLPEVILLGGDRVRFRAAGYYATIGS